MFFSDRIKSINDSDKVLEIGPGSSPHERSDVLLEKKYEKRDEYTAQVGHQEKLITDKKIVYYEGDRFPFNDNEFDYVICSHVLEHVDDVELFLAEIFRVAGKGYFEYPLIYYEYLYNFKVHLNLLKFDSEMLHYMKKSDTALNDFTPVQLFFYESLNKGHEKLTQDLLPLMMEGFEWHAPFKISRVNTIADLVHKEFSMPLSSPGVNSSTSARNLIKQLIKKVIPGE